jgi:nitric oxide reductase subunit C
MFNAPDPGNDLISSFKSFIPLGGTYGEGIMGQRKTWRYLAVSLGLSVLSVGLIQSLAQAGPKEGKAAPGKGAELLKEQGCLHCHYVKGDGGLIGPPLDGIEKYRTEDDIVATLTRSRPLPDHYPRGIVDPREFMKHVKLSRATAREIARYLMTAGKDEDQLVVKGHGEDEPETLPEGFKFTPSAPSESSRKGLAKYKDSGCQACHAIGGVGGRVGPALDGIGARMSRSFMENRIARGAIVFFGDKEYRPSEYIMPPSQLSKEEIAQITDFLMTLPAGGKNAR